MIYETAVVLNPQSGDQAVNNLKTIVETVLKDFSGKVLLSDDWGTVTFAQPTSRGLKQGRYIYFLYQADTKANAELERRFRINESLIKNIIVKLGEDKEQEAIVKEYCTPYSPTHKPQDNLEQPEIEDDSERGERGDRGDRGRKMSRNRSCWFSANKKTPDWKNPYTYRWIVNEFGKISPARSTGIRRKFQKQAASAIKRARCMGLASAISGRLAHN